MKKQILTVALLVATTVAYGQTIPTYLGIGIADPVGTLHVHSYEKVEDLHEPIFIQEEETEAPQNVIPPYGQDHYRTEFHMTNTATGATKNDGFAVVLYDNNLSFVQRENAAMTFETPGGKFMLNGQGQFGIGATYQGYGFNADVKARFAKAVRMEQGLTVAGGLTVGNGMTCDAQGNLKVKHLRVTLTDWPDYVFGEGYSLRPLGEVKEYVKTRGHLPGVPSAEEVERDGADLGEMNRVLLQKVEELTLYIIDLQRQIDELKSNQ